MADGFDEDMTRCPCCDGEGYFYHGDEPKSPWGDAATIARLTAELAQARAEAVAQLEEAVELCASVDSLELALVGAGGLMNRIRDLATEPGTIALAEMLDAETRACAEVALRIGPVLSDSPYLDGMQACASQARAAILARIDQRKGAGK